METIITNKHEPVTYGYIRVSSKGQHEDRQRDALLKEGVMDALIFCDKESGKNFERAQYQVLKSKLKEGDELVILDIDRLGRNYDEMALEWREITKVKGCNIRVINLPLLNTVKAGETLDTRFLADMIFSLLSYVAERERMYSKSRQREGIEAAHKKGVRFGRPVIEKPEEFDRLYEQVLRHEITSKEARTIMRLRQNKYYEFVGAYRREHNLS